MAMHFTISLAAGVQIFVETKGRPWGLYVVALQAMIEGDWQTIRLFDNAHGQHDTHRYTGSEKQPAERFTEGTPREVVPVAIRHLVDHWEAILRSWKS